jgi:hypothetical protein
MDDAVIDRNAASPINTLSILERICQAERIEISGPTPAGSPQVIAMRGRLPGIPREVIEG